MASPTAAERTSPVAVRIDRSLLSAEAAIASFPAMIGGNGVGEMGLIKFRPHCICEEEFSIG
jgi:hypothetical protein